MKHSSLLSLTLLMGCRAASHRPVERPAYASAEQAIASVLAVDTTWHIATNADCRNGLLKDMLSDNSAYQAYDLIADVNTDGLPDHIFALVKGDSGRLYVALARDSGYDAPQLFATLDWITEGGFVLQEPAITFGRFYSDVSATWKWNPSTGHLELVPDRPEPEP